MNPKIENIYGKDADYFLKTCNLSNPENIPINIKTLFKKLGISVIPFPSEVLRKFNIENLETKYGYLLSASSCRNENVAIFYTPNSRLMSYMYDYHSQEAIIYELGYLCKYGEESHIYTSHAEKDETILDFVGELLIPEQHLKKALADLILPTTKALEDIFQVSHETLIRRLQQLNIKTKIAGYNY